jgi:hypothetical protein
VKIFLNYLLVMSAVTSVVFSASDAIADEKQDCSIRESGIESCSAPEDTDPLARQMKDNSAGVTNAASATPFVTATGQGNSNAACPLCNPGDVTDPQSPHGIFVPGKTPGSGTTSGQEVER